jgi:UDP-glucose 4-epimerase
VKILVTGSNGYIGRHLCAMLEEKNYEVHKLDYDINPDLRQYIYDIRDAKELKNGGTSFHTYDAVIHLAALVRVGESVHYPTLYYDTNINGTLNVIQRIKYKNFIFASTGAASNPLSPYGLSKRVAEDIVAEQCKHFTTFRFYNVTGTGGFPATNPDGLFYNLTQAIETRKFHLHGTDYNTKDGTCVREYIHVNDVCDALIRAIDTPTNGVENLAYNDTRTVKEIVNIFKEVNNVDFDVIYKDVRPGDLESMYLPDPSKFMVRNYTYEQMLKL